MKSNIKNTSSMTAENKSKNDCQAKKNKNKTIEIVQIEVKTVN